MLTEIADRAQSYLGEVHHSLVNRTAIGRERLEHLLIQHNVIAPARHLLVWLKGGRYGHVVVSPMNR
jgi:hypothetical protein